MRSLLDDVRYAIRLLRKFPGFVFVAVTILAVGMVANWDDQCVNWRL